MLLVALATIALTATPAFAGNGRSAARSTGDDLVGQLMQKGTGQACTEKSRQAFVGGGATYLASCTGQRGDFRFLVVVQAKPGGARVDYPWVQARIDDVCHGDGGAVYSVGVKDRFVAMYLGRGADTDTSSGAATAYGLWTGLAQQLQGTAGRFVAATACADGRVTKKLI